MPIHYTDINELRGEQADILWELLTLNPYLVKRPSMSLNQQLDTKNARIISAINEINSNANSAKRSVAEAMDYVNTVVGDAGDPAVQDKLDDLGGNIIDATYNLRNKVDGILDQAKSYTDEKLSSVNIDIVDGGTF